MLQNYNFSHRIFVYLIVFYSSLYCVYIRNTCLRYNLKMIVIITSMLYFDHMINEKRNNGDLIIWNEGLYGLYGMSI